jgi:3-phosphoglycerate kinase
VAVKEGKVREKYKIFSVRETLDWLLEKGAKVALLSHLGRPQFTDTSAFLSGRNDLKRKVLRKFSLGNISRDIGEILEKKIKFVNSCVGEAVAKNLEKLSEGEVLLLENARLYPGEEIADPRFARDIAANFDLFVNDAFGVCHRDQASVVEVAKVIPSYAGLRIQKEIENLKRVKERPKTPAVAILGGAKIETKLPLIKMFEGKYERVLVGGKIAVEAQSAGINFLPHVILPVDYAQYKKDIGPKTIDRFRDIISKAKTIVWNGPLGEFENPPFDTGTREILNAIVSSNAFTVVGGGESVQVLEENNLIDKVSFVSTGGGAMLEFLSGNDLPGVEALADKRD